MYVVFIYQRCGNLYYKMCCDVDVKESTSMQRQSLQLMLIVNCPASAGLQS